MKLLIVATVEAPSHNDISEARRNLMKALSTVKERTNNGSEIKISYCDAENNGQITSLFGKLKWWSLGHSPDRRTIKRNNGQTSEDSNPIDELFSGDF